MRELPGVWAKAAAASDVGAAAPGWFTGNGCRSR